MPGLLGDFRGIPAGLSLRLFVLGTDLCEFCFSSSLLRPSADGDPHPRWPTHQNKRDRGSWFPDKHHSLSLLSEGQGARRFISRGSPPRYRLPPARRPITQELLKANVSQGEGVAFLPEVSPWWPREDHCARVFPSV